MDPPSKLLFPARSPSLPLEVSIEYPTPTSCSSTIPPSSLTSSRASSPGMDPMISQLGTSANPHKNAFGTGDHPVWVPTMNSENTVSSSAPTSYLDSSKSTTTSSSPRLTDAFLDHPGWAELTSSPDPPDLPLLFTSTSVAPRTDDGWMTPPYFTGALFSPSTPPVLYVSPRQLHLPPPPPPFILSSATAAAVVVEFPAASESRSTSVPVAPAQFQAVYAAAATDSFSAAATAVMTTREATASPSCCSTPSWVASADSNTHWVDDCSSTMSCTRDFAQQHLFDSPRRSSSPPGTPYITNLPTGTACDEVEMPVDLPPPPPPPPPIPLPLTSISTSTGSSRGRFTRRESPAYGERPAARWRTNSPVVLAAGSAGSKPRAASARAAAREARRNVAAAAAAAAASDATAEEPSPPERLVAARETGVSSSKVVAVGSKAVAAAADLLEDGSGKVVCTLCDRQFSRKTDLLRHERTIHMAEKPYKCGCGKDFARRDALLRHCKVVGCSIDSATYTDSSSSPISAAPSSLGDDGHLTGDFAAATAAAPRSSRSPKVDWDECYGPSCGSAAASSAAAYY